MEQDLEKAPLEQKDPVIIYVIALLGIIVASGILTAVGGESNVSRYFSFFIPQFFYIGTVFIYLKLTKKEFSLSFKEKIKESPLSLPLAAVVGVGVFFFALLPNYGIQRLFALLGKEAEVYVPAMTEWYHYLLSLVVICILPAFGEELLFRKVFADSMSEVDERKVILILGAIFSLTHFNLAQTVHQFFIGCLYAYVYLRTKNVLLPMIMHLVNNVLALFLTEVTGAAVWDGLPALLISFFVGLAVAGAGIFFLLKGKTKLDKEKSGRLSRYPVFLVAGAGVVWLVAALL